MALKISDVFKISGAQISTIYVKNKMGVHFQGMSKTMEFPQTIFLQGAPTCSVGISPEGIYNRINDAGRLTFINQKAMQLASVPFIRTPASASQKRKVKVEPGKDRDYKTVMLTSQKPGKMESRDDIPVPETYYHKPVSERQVSISIAAPFAEITYKLDKIRVVRKFVSPFLSGNIQTLMPIGVEEYEIANTSNTAQQINLVVPRPSLANLQQKKYRPIDQDSAYICTMPLRAYAHEAFKLHMDRC